MSIGHSDSLALRISQGLNKIGLAARHNEWTEAARLKLSSTQAQVLSLLFARGPCRLSELATELAVTSATVSDAVSSLAAKGLVAKRKSRADARALAIVLTRSGREQAKRIAAWPDLLATAVETLTPLEQMTFHRALVKMICALQERGQISIARMCVNCTFFRPGVYPDSDKPHHCDFVDAAFGDSGLRIECADFQAATTAEGRQKWLRIVSAFTPVHVRNDEL